MLLFVIFSQDYVDKHIHINNIHLTISVDIGRCLAIHSLFEVKNYIDKHIHIGDVYFAVAIEVVTQYACKVAGVAIANEPPCE